MGSINRSHNEADGGVLLFQGELILLYCDSISCEIGGKESFKGRVYLTTHRLVVTVTPYRQNAPVKSLCAPFCAIVKCHVEQPMFSANYIEATVRDEADPARSFTFKLKFSKGGAIELAMAMNRAVQAVGRNINPSTPQPPAYTPSPSAQYYQAPPTVYAPGYNTGVQMPIQQFPDQPPIGFIYTSSAPPPYPGLANNTGGYGQPGAGGAQAPPPYGQPPASIGGYPGSQAPQTGGYPGPQAPQTGGYPGPQAPQSGGYSPAQQPGGYPGAYPPPQQQQQQTHPGYPGGQQQPPAQPGGGYPGYSPTSAGPNQPAQAPQQPSGYPDLSQQQPGQQPAPTSGSSSWPSAPSFNPNWQDNKKEN